LEILVAPDAKMLAAIRAREEILLDLLFIEDFLALGAFRPHAIRHLARSSSAILLRARLDVLFRPCKPSHEPAKRNSGQSSAGGIPPLFSSKVARGLIEFCTNIVIGLWPI